MVGTKRLLLPVLCALALMVTPLASSILSAQSTTPTTTEPSTTMPATVPDQDPNNPNNRNTPANSQTPGTIDQPNPDLPSDVTREKPAPNPDLEQSTPQTPAPSTAAPSTPATSSPSTSTPAGRQTDPAAPATTTTPAAQQPSPATTQDRSRPTAPATADTGRTSGGALPGTAGELPLVGLIGVLSLSARMALAKIRR